MFESEISYYSCLNCGTVCEMSESMQTKLMYMSDSMVGAWCCPRAQLQAGGKLHGILHGANCIFRAAWCSVHEAQGLQCYSRQADAQHENTHKVPAIACVSCHMHNRVWNIPIKTTRWRLQYETERKCEEWKRHAKGTYAMYETQLPWPWGCTGNMW
jgi:hypothetical protein